MKLHCLLAVSALSVLAPLAGARPATDRLGICYLFKASKLVTRGPCVLSGGYGAGAQYMLMTLNGQAYYAEYPNLRPNTPPTLNGRPAIAYERDAAFFAILKGARMEGEDYLTCIKTKDARTDVCYLDPSQ